MSRTIESEPLKNTKFQQITSSRGVMATRLTSNQKIVGSTPTVSVFCFSWIHQDYIQCFVLDINYHLDRCINHQPCGLEASVVRHQISYTVIARKLTMHYNSKHLEIQTPDSLLQWRKVPLAASFLTATYIVLTITLLFVRRSQYSQLIDEGSDVSFDSVYSPALQMVPNQILKHPYSIILSNLVDVRIWKIIANSINLLIGGTFIERNAESSKELLKFILVIGSITNLLVVIVTLSSSLVVPGVKIDVPIDGNYTALVGFPIVYKQLFPETSIFKIKDLGMLSKNFRFKLLPIFVMCTLTIGQLVFFHHFAQLLSIWITFFSCWIYLRYFQVLTSTQNSSYMVGDASDTFQLIYFFPDLVKPILRPIFDSTHRVFIKLKLIRPFQTDEVDRSNAVAEQRGAKKISDPVEERRKQLALQVLQERMV